MFGAREGCVQHALLLRLLAKKNFFDLGLGVPPESQVTRFVRVNAHQDAPNTNVIIID